jgi:8-oxo-dGTP pyrophosphatase MutT (NUDIX family)
VGKNTQDQTVLIFREFSSGGAVFKRVKELKSARVEVLWLVTATMPSKLYPKIYWRLPKGWIDNESPDIPGPMASGDVKADEESLKTGALREVREEGGVKAKIVSKIGTEKYFFNAPNKGKILKFVTFYLMEWVRDLPEGHDEETSEIAWLSFEEAYKKLSFSGEKQILKKAKNGLP